MNTEELQKVVEKLWGKMETINERTKRQTDQIHELQKKIKELEGKK
jgi:peptidoglycan hydrolase CwlO-like protein